MFRNVKKYKAYLIKNKNDNKNENENKNMRADKIDNENMKMNDKNENNEREINNRTVKALLSHSDEKKPAKTICYEDINLLLLLNLIETRDLLRSSIHKETLKTN